MVFLSKLESIGVIACPGSGEFTKEVVEHLHNYLSQDIEDNLQALSFNKKLSRQEIQNKLSLISEMTQEVYEPYSNPHYNLMQKGNFFINTKFIKFANGEFKAEILSSIRGKDIYVFQDAFNGYPLFLNEQDDKQEVLSVNDHLMLLFTVIDACYHASARSINLVLPAYPYARQDRRQGREALSAARIAQILESLGVNLILTLDIHSRAIENSFKSLKMENLLPAYQICKSLKKVISLKDPDLVMVAPDTGAVDRNKYYASNLKRPLALLYKERDYSRVSLDAQNSNIISHRLLGNVADKNVFMADDMIGTGGTLIEAMKHLKEMKAKRIIAAASLPLFSGKAIESFQNAYERGYFDILIGTNAIYHNEHLLNAPWYRQASVSKLFSEAIWRIHQNISMSSLLDSSLQIQKLLLKEE